MSVETCSNSFATWPFTATRQVAREAAANEIHWVSSVSCVLVTRFTRCRNIILVKCTVIWLWPFYLKITCEHPGSWFPSCWLHPTTERWPMNSGSGIIGLPVFLQVSVVCCFPTIPISGGSVATIQALSGTGSLQCIAQFLKFMGVSKVGVETTAHESSDEGNTKRDEKDTKKDNRDGSISPPSIIKISTQVFLMDNHG